MDLSKKERLILFNQYEILKELKKDDIIAVREYEKNQDILFDGYHYDLSVDEIIEIVEAPYQNK